MYFEGGPEGFLSLDVLLIHTIDYSRRKHHRDAIILIYAVKKFTLSKITILLALNTRSRTEKFFDVG